MRGDALTLMSDAMVMVSDVLTLMSDVMVEVSDAKETSDLMLASGNLEMEMMVGTRDLNCSLGQSYGLHC